LKIDHYENFPVASIILPAKEREAILGVYAFARTADDIADDPDLPKSFKKERLTFYREELNTIYSGGSPNTALFSLLGHVSSSFGISKELFSRLLDAFEQDLEVDRYETFGELMSYCEKSANPVGEIVLTISNQATEQSIRLSNKICTALQIINFLQDIKTDYGIGRIYMPTAELKEYDLGERSIKTETFNLAWQDFMKFQLSRVEKILLEGAELTNLVTGRLRLELRAIICAAQRTILKIRQTHGNIFMLEAKLNKWDWLVIAKDVLTKRL